MTIALDGSLFQTANPGYVTGSNTATATGVNFAGTSDVIIALVENNSNSGSYVPAATSTGVSGGGLTWHFRGRVQWSATYKSTVEIWYAVASAALTSSTITVTWAASATPAYSSIKVFALSGANT